MITEIERFRTAVSASSELRQGLESANGTDELDSVAKYASSKGYNFSAAELEEYGKQKAGSELSDSELDTVAGGTTGAGSGNSLGRKIRLWLVGVDVNF